MSEHDPSEKAVYSECELFARDGLSFCEVHGYCYLLQQLIDQFPYGPSSDGFSEAEFNRLRNNSTETANSVSCVKFPEIEGYQKSNGLES